MAKVRAPGRAQSKQMGAPQFASSVVDYWTQRARELLQARNNLTRDDLEYVVQQVSKLKDERLKACVAELIGWGDDERAELETFCAIALEIMKKSNPSKLREAALTVELRYQLKEKDDAVEEAAQPGQADPGTG